MVKDITAEESKKLNLRRKVREAMAALPQFDEALASLDRGEI